MGEIVIPVNGLKLDGTNNWFALKERKKEKVGIQGQILLQFAIPTPKGRALSAAQRREIKQKLKEADGNKELFLDLEALGIDRLPSWVASHLAHFTTFALGFNKFSDFPDLSPFKNLQSLNLSGNQLTALPPSIGMLVQLKELLVNGNLLKTLPPELGDLVSLEKLNIANNQIKRLVDDIGNLRKLEDLNATGNPLTILPPSIGECQNMEVLDLSCCELTALPDQFPHMAKLLELNLGSNKLTELPENMGMMSRLVVLNLSDNDLKDLPLSMGHCIGLGKLGAGINLDRNPIKSSDMMKKWKIGTDHLCDFLEKRMISKGTPPMKQVERIRPPPRKSSAPAPAAAKSTSTSTPTSTSTSTSNGKEEVGVTSPKLSPLSSSQPATVESKILALVQWAENCINSEISVKIRHQINLIRQVQSLPDALAVAQILTAMKPLVLKSHDLLTLVGIPLPQPVAKVQEADKLKAVQLTIENALREFLELMNQIKVALRSATNQQHVLGLVAVVKDMNKGI
eukprot:TRINITY_DN1775_c0_g1_i1.p1 TRINITY_DN1775_c0_g1~~TRINITY_DN1775_c0_g1_i1.p1  ORF type:complete len:603 (+),score=187.01 TRINITY_DN1775_c0_g1_i1:271-1809(+)